jgi:ankyrin repeat protein
MKGHGAVVALLLDAGADREAKMISDGYTALMIAAEKGHLDAVKVLLANKADVKAKSIAGWTALHVAAQNGHEAVVKSLLIKKPDINAKAGANGPTPLCQATMKGRKGVVALLLDSGADPKLGCKRLWKRVSPKLLAETNGHKGAAELLSKRQG